MSDNRNFVNKFANQGGGDIYVEDAKLSEISTKTAIASEGVMLKGTDGAYYEIDKASLSEVVRAELGAILADNSHDNGTSVAKVPTLNSTDNVLGSSSIANLASVLGAVTTNRGSANIDSPSDQAFYMTSNMQANWTCQRGLPGTAISSAAFLLSLTYSSTLIFQIVYNFDDNKLYGRIYVGAWSTWSAVGS